MGCCGKGGDDEKPKGIVTDRSCRDVPCLILFLVFWAGMAVVGYEALSAGDPNRLLYGVDSYGHYCGSVNTIANSTDTIDLTKAKQLYYLNPLELLDTNNYYYAKSICVEACPGQDKQCAPSDIPCQRSDQYLCPYYNYTAFAENDSLAIADVDGGYSTNWWGALDNYLGTSCVDAAFLANMPQYISDSMNATLGCGNYYQAQSMYPGMGPCHAIFFNTSSFMNRCYPIIPPEYYASISASAAGGAAAAGASADQIGQVVDKISAMSDEGFSMYVTDAQRGFVIIMAAGLGASLVFCFVYLILLRFFSGVMAWMTVVGLNLMMVACTVLAAHKSGLLTALGGEVGAQISSELQTSTGGSITGDQKQVLQIITWVLLAITVLLFLFTLLMIRRIKIAVATIKVAANAIGSMPTLLLFPIFTFLTFVALFVYWVIVFAYMWSAGNMVQTYRAAGDPEPEGFTINTLFNSTAAGTSVDASSSITVGDPLANVTTTESTIPCYDDPDCYYSVEFSQRQQYMFAYHLFGLLWTNQLIIGFGYVVIAGAVAQYYWHRGIKAEMPRRPVALAIKNAAWYHLGSIALGAFIVAVIQFVRLLLEYIDRKTKKMQQGNPAAKWIMCCLRYVLWYLEKVMKFINRNAYIMVAVKGTGYCSSAFRAVKLIINNALRLAAINIIGDSLMFLGKITVVAGAGAIAFLMTDLKQYTDVESDTYLTSPVIPVLLAVVAAYVVASIFFSVYEMAIDTILLSFCEDCEANDGDPLYAPKLLMSAIGKAKKFEAQQQAGGSVADGGQMIKK